MKVNVFSLPPIPLLLVTLDAELGIGLTQNVFLAPKDGLSMLKTFVFLFLINAKFMMMLVFALLVTMDMI